MLAGLFGSDRTYLYKGQSIIHLQFYLYLGNLIPLIYTADNTPIATCSLEKISPIYGVCCWSQIWIPIFQNINILQHCYPAYIIFLRDFVINFCSHRHWTILLYSFKTTINFIRDSGFHASIVVVLIWRELWFLINTIN